MKRFFLFVFCTVTIIQLFVRSSFAQLNKSLTVLSPTPKVSVDYTLPYPGILPDHPLYFIKEIRDKTLLWITNDPVKKSQLLLLMSDKKLAMGKILMEKQSTTLATQTFKESEKLLLDAVILLASVKREENLSPNTIEKFEFAIKKHEEVIVNLQLNETLGVTNQATRNFNDFKSKN